MERQCKQVCRGVRGPLCLHLRVSAPAEANPDAPIEAIIDLGLRLARASFYGKATGTLSMQESAIIAGQIPRGNTGNKTTASLEYTPVCLPEQVGQGF